MDSIITFITALAALLTGGIGIWQAFLTRKSIENNSRPYIIIYNEVKNVIEPIEYIILKNTGNTPAQIVDIIYDEAQLSLMFPLLTISKNNISEDDQTIKENEATAIYPNQTLNNYKNSIIAPNQSFYIPICNRPQFDKITFTIKYKSFNNRKKEYIETLTLNLQQNIVTTFIKGTGSDALSDTLQEILKKM